MVVEVEELLLVTQVRELQGALVGRVLVPVLQTPVA